MKNTILILLLVISGLSSFSQAPHSFRYQTVIRSNTGELMTNKAIGLKISILKDSQTGIVVYAETFLLLTNPLGLINLSVGTGNTISGSIDNIEWGDGTYYLRIDLDKDGGSNYEFMGTSQLLSVPYALYAEKSGGGSEPFESYWKKNGSSLYYNEGNIGIGTDNPVARLNILGSVEEGDERAFIRLKNMATGDRATVSIALQSFEDKGAAFGYTSKNYSLNDLSDFGVFTTNGRGFALVAYTGQIRFYTNKKPDNSYDERMRINEEGNVGIGTSDPNAKLEVKGDVYINDITSGIIMISPNGQCWRGTLNNSGTLEFAPVPCP